MQLNLWGKRHMKGARFFVGIVRMGCSASSSSSSGAGRSGGVGDSLAARFVNVSKAGGTTRQPTGSVVATETAAVAASSKVEKNAHVYASLHSAESSSDRPSQRRPWVSSPQNKEKKKKNWTPTVQLRDKKRLDAEIVLQKRHLAYQTKVLALRDYGLKKVPSEVFRDSRMASSLTTCDLSLNRLREVPPKIANCGNLQVLWLNSNEISLMPSSICTNLPRLTRFSIAHNRLTSLPDDFRCFSALSYLDLSSNQIAQLPPHTFEDMSQLTELNIANNRLEHLPPSLYSLQPLTHLYLQENQIATISPEIGYLVELQCLNLSHNLLHEIPADLLKNTKVAELWLNGNRITQPKLVEMDGFQAFAARRKLRLDKQVASKVLQDLNFSLCGLD